VPRAVTPDDYLELSDLAPDPPTLAELFALLRPVVLSIGYDQLLAEGT
jgi:hypothetical protein